MRQYERWHSKGSQIWSYLNNPRAMITYERGRYLYTPDQPAQMIFLVVSGLVRLQLISPEGRALTIRVVEPGQLCGHVALTFEACYDTFAEAISTAQVYTVYRQDIQQAMFTHPELALNLIDEICWHRMTVSQRLDEVAFKSVPARLASLLIAMAPHESPNNAIRLPRRTHQQLADMINAQRETVTKTINEFRAARLVDVDRTAITILNVDRLRELASR